MTLRLDVVLSLIKKDRWAKVSLFRSLQINKQQNQIDVINLFTKDFQKKADDSVSVQWNIPHHLTIKLYKLLTLSWRGLLSYRNQSIDLQSKSMDWFLYGNGLRYEKFKPLFARPHERNFLIKWWFSFKSISAKWVKNSTFTGIFLTKKYESLWEIA